MHLEYKIKIAALIDVIDRTLNSIHTQRMSVATVLIQSFINQFEVVTQSLSDSKFNEQLFMTFAMIIECMEKKDYLLLADYLDLGIKEPLCRHLENEHSNDDFIFDKDEYEKFMTRVVFEKEDEYLRVKLLENLQRLREKGYELESTSTGMYTLRRTVNERTFYMCTNNNPLNVSYQLAEEWAKERKEQYSILGMGLFYAIGQLSEIAENALIEVYEEDINIIKIVAGYIRSNAFFKTSNIKIIYDPMYLKFFKRFHCMNTEDTQLCFYYPSILAIGDEALREKVLGYFTELDNINRWKTDLLKNFTYNTSITSHTVDELKERFINKDLYIVAAGPSLDKNLECLRDVNQEKSIVLCVGTVFRKLLHARIPIDYVIATDPKPYSYIQFDGLMDHKIPLIGMSTMNKNIFGQYSGKKYIMYQKGFMQAEQEAASNHGMLINTGGSVSTTAIDLGIQMKCRRIICLGMDLAHTGNQLHASLPGGVDESENQAGSIMIDGYYGGKVSTSKTFDMFRKWIENRITKVNDIEIYNATEGGAYIKGMKNVSLSEIVKE